MSLPPTQTTDTEHNDWVTKNNVSSVEEKKLHTHTHSGPVTPLTPNI